MKPTQMRIVVFTALLGCSQPTGGGDGGDPDLGVPADQGAGDLSGPPGDLAQPAGPRFDDGLHGFVLLGARQTPYDESGVAEAQIYRDPRPRFQREVMRAGACRLLLFSPAFCDRCDGVCVADGVCQPFGVRVSAGKIEVTGTQPMLTMTPDEYLFYRPSVPVKSGLVPAGAKIQVAASGAEVAAFSASTTGVEKLVSAAIKNDEITIKDGEDHRFTWQKGATPGARVRLTLNANNRGHGAPYQGIIECDEEDGAGEVTISKALIAAFPRTYRWEICAGSDCPLSSVARYQRAVGVSRSGSVAVDAASIRQFFVLHNP